MEEKSSVLSIVDANATPTNSYSTMTNTGTNTATSGTITFGNNLYYPYYYTTPTYNYKDIIVRKVENGWIVVKLGKEYICSNEKDLAKLITKEEK